MPGPVSELGTSRPGTRARPRRPLAKADGKEPDEEACDAADQGHDDEVLDPRARTVHGIRLLVAGIARRDARAPAGIRRQAALVGHMGDHATAGHLKRTCVRTATPMRNARLG